MQYIKFSIKVLIREFEYFVSKWRLHFAFSPNAAT